MLKPKPKAKLTETLQAMTSADMKSRADRVMQKLFGVGPDWYKQLDFVKNNYLLGLMHFRKGHYHDAVLRFKMTTWFDGKYADAWYYLGRAYLMEAKRPQAEKALKKAIALKANPQAEKILAAIPVMFGEKTPPIIVKKAGAPAAATLAVLHRDAFAVAWSEKSFQEMFETAGTEAWIVGLEHLPMGMIVGRALPDEYEILTLAVSPDWRGRRLAGLVFNEAMASAKAHGAKAVVLDVAVDNEVAVMFYERAGFNTINRRTAYYRQPDGTMIDALVMKKELA